MRLAGRCFVRLGIAGADRSFPKLRKAVTVGLILVAVFAVPLSTPASAAVLELTADRDNTLFADDDLSNGAGPALFAGNTGSGATRRALLFFDLAGRLPPGARVDSVSVTLQVTNAPDDFARPFTLHRVRGDWGEAGSIATGGAGAAAQVGDATWRAAFYPARPWAAAGGDFEPMASSSRSVEGLGSYTWRGAGLTADVRGWLIHPDSNDGWLLRGEESSAQTARRFASREVGEAYARPTITIHYTPAAITRSQSWGGIKAAYR